MARSIDARLQAFLGPLEEREAAAAAAFRTCVEALLTPAEQAVWANALRRWARGEAPPYTPEELAVDDKLDADPEAVTHWRAVLAASRALDQLEGTP